MNQFDFLIKIKTNIETEADKWSSTSNSKVNELWYGDGFFENFLLQDDILNYSSLQ